MKPVPSAKGGPPRADREAVAAYFAAQPTETRGMLEELRGIIRSVAPEATEGFSYRMPVFRQNGTLAWIAGFRNHCGLFGIRGSIMDSFGSELDGYRTGKGTIQFAFGKPLPEALIRRLVRSQIELNSAKQGTGKKKNAKA